MFLSIREALPAVTGVLLAAAVAAAPGCKDKKAGSGGTAETTGASEGSGEAAPASERSKTPVYRELLAEAARAELSRGGITIDFGTPDQQKYIRGGWGTGWDPAPEGVTAAAAITGAGARLHAYFSEEPVEIIGRMRMSEGTGTLSFRAGKKKWSAEVGSEWTEIRVPVEGFGTGHQIVQLNRSPASGQLLVEWLTFATAAGRDLSAPLPRVAPLKLGGRPKRALIAPDTRTYSFYLQVPDGAHFIVDIGSAGETEFEVSAQPVDGDAVELLSETVSGDRWTEKVIDLAPIAGKTVRLDLSTSGSGAAGWAEPAIHRATRVEPPKLSGKTAKNVVIVVLDTTRADAFAPFYPNEVETPELDSLAKRGTAFTHAYNNENWTKPSCATILSGLYPESHTAREATADIPDEVYFLSQHLKKSGFKTASFIANAVVNERFGFDRGFDEFNNVARDPVKSNGSELYKAASEWLEQQAESDERFMLWVQSVEPHTTYGVPQAYSAKYFDGAYNGPVGDDFDVEEQIRVDNGSWKLSERDLQWIWALYWGEVTYQDEHLGRFLKKLEELGRLEDTIVVVTNDHGEEIGDHNQYGHGYTLYDEMIRAPLTIHYPPLFPAGGQIDEVVEHVDLAPTLVEALGLPAMDGPDGLSLLPLVRGEPRRPRPYYAVGASRNSLRSIRVGSWKLIDHETKGWLRLFNVAEDPKEQVDKRKDATLAGRYAEIYLGEALGVPEKSSRLSALQRARTIEGREAEIDEEMRKQLEALGYL